jgi:hypothetical protein
MVGNRLDVWLVKQLGGGFLSQLNRPDEQTEGIRRRLTNVAANPSRRYHQNFGDVEREKSLTVPHSSVDAGKGGSEVKLVQNASCLAQIPLAPTARLFANKRGIDSYA